VLDGLEPKGQIERAGLERQRLARRELDNLESPNWPTSARTTEPGGEEHFGEADGPQPTSRAVRDPDPH
jgi:hypothetical protein